MQTINDKTFPRPENGACVAVVHAERCDGCAFCVDICPTACIEIVSNPRRRGHRIAVVDAAACSGCGACQGTCPKEAVAIPGLSLEDLRGYVRQAIGETG